MAENRTLKLNLLADTKDFVKGLKHASGYSKTFAGRVGSTMRNAAMAMGVAAAAAGALAVKLGIDSVKAAIDDEASQKRLAATLKKTTKATDAQVASTEKWITAQQFSKGYTDTELRAALGRLTVATRNQTRAQELLTVAQDVARGTGKDLESVSTALAKAYNGNFGALTRLGIPLDQATIKSKDFDKALQSLIATYGGQASTYADTFAGRMAILNQRWDELKETLGVKIVGALSDLLPWVQRIIAVMAGDADNSLSNKVKSLRRGLDGEGAGTDNLATSLKSVGKAFSDLFDALVGGDSQDANDRLNNIADAFQRLANGINALAAAWGRLDRFVKSPQYQKFLDLTFGPEGTSWLGVTKDFKPSGTKAIGGTVRAGGTYLVGEHGPEMLTIGARGGYVTRNGNLGGGGTTVINLNGIVDAESARRAIERIIQQSSRRTGAVSWNPVLT